MGGWLLFHVVIMIINAVVTFIAVINNIGMHLARLGEIRLSPHLFPDGF